MADRRPYRYAELDPVEIAKCNFNDLNDMKVILDSEEEGIKVVTGRIFNIIKQKIDNGDMAAQQRLNLLDNTLTHEINETQNGLNQAIADFGRITDDLVDKDTELTNKIDKADKDIESVTQAVADEKTRAEAQENGIRESITEAVNTLDSSIEAVDAKVDTLETKVNTEIAGAVATLDGRIDEVASLAESNSSAIAGESETRENVDSQLNAKIDTETADRIAEGNSIREAVNNVKTDVDNVKSLIPISASVYNPLVDKATLDNFQPDFTQAQLNAINSGINSNDVLQIIQNEKDIEEIKPALAKKAETTYVNTELGKKANSADVNTALNGKEDKNTLNISGMSVSVIDLIKDCGNNNVDYRRFVCDLNGGASNITGTPRANISFCMNAYKVRYGSSNDWAYYVEFITNSDPSPKAATIVRHTTTEIVWKDINVQNTYSPTSEAPISGKGVAQVVGNVEALLAAL